MIGAAPTQKAGIELGLGQNKRMSPIKQSANPSPKTALGDRIQLVEISKTTDWDSQAKEVAGQNDVGGNQQHSQNIRIRLDKPRKRQSMAQTSR